MASCVFQMICSLAVFLILLSLSDSGQTNESDLLCISSIKVPRNTVFRASVMSVLKINCTVTTYNCPNIPRVSWCKLYDNDCKTINHSDYIETEWNNLTENYGMAFLIFLNISMEDEGSYRCTADSAVSHTINVTVTVDNKDNRTARNESTTDLKNNPEDFMKKLWPYLYICGGIVLLVVIVLTVSLCIIKSQGSKSSRRNKRPKNQYKGTQSDLTPTPPSHSRGNIHYPLAEPNSASPCVYDTPPVRAGSHRDRPSAGRVSGDETKSKGSHNHGDTERGVEESHLVYASLNHQAMTRVPKRTPRNEPEPSEYAAIRFR